MKSSIAKKENVLPHPPSPTKITLALSLLYIKSSSISWASLS